MFFTSGNWIGSSTLYISVCLYLGTFDSEGFTQRLYILSSPFSFLHYEGSEWFINGTLKKLIVSLIRICGQSLVRSLFIVEFNSLTSISFVFVSLINWWF